MDEEFPPRDLPAEIDLGRHRDLQGRMLGQWIRRGFLALLFVYSASAATADTNLLGLGNCLCGSNLVILARIAAVLDSPNPACHLLQVDILVVLKGDCGDLTTITVSVDVNVVGLLSLNVGAKVILSGNVDIDLVLNINLDLGFLLCPKNQAKRQALLVNVKVTLGNLLGGLLCSLPFCYDCLLRNVEYGKLSATEIAALAN